MKQNNSIRSRSQWPHTRWPLACWDWG